MRRFVSEFVHIFRCIDRAICGWYHRLTILEEKNLPPLESGRRVFNAGRFFEAHDVWEAEWLEATGPRRLLLQGLIQIAAALYKASRRERPAGCVQLLRKGLAKLELFPEGEAGLALEPFRRNLANVLAEAVAWRAGGPPPDPASFPRLRCR